MPKAKTLRSTAGPDVAEFIGTFCRTSKGEWAGRPLELQPWQRTLLDDMFALRPDGRRKHRVAYIGMPRKNGKSTICSALALYGLLADGEPGAEVYSVAGDKTQAGIVFEEAKNMVRADPDLSEMVRIMRYHMEVPSTRSIYRVVSADAGAQQGLNPSFVVFDEVHVQPSDELWGAMTLGSGTRRQPFVIGITTAGHDQNSVAYRLYQYGKRVTTGEIDDPTFFFRWWEPSREECDHRDPAVWAEANPGFGVLLKPEDFEATARQIPEHQFRRFRLNQWTATSDAWLPYGAWDACEDQALDLDPGLPTYVAIDVALRNDSTAVVCAQKQGGRTVTRARVWENPYQESDPRHKDWELNIFEVENHLRELRQRFPVPSTTIDDEVMPGPEFSYDPAYFHRSAAVLEGEGLAMVRFAQHDSLMVPASQTLYQLVVEGKLAHDGDPTLKRHIGNAVADQKARGWRLTKPKGQRQKKIDAAIACAIAIYRAQLAPTIEPSVYEGRGLLIL